MGLAPLSAAGELQEAALLEMRIELGEAGEGRDRHQEVAARTADQALDFAFVVALAGAVEEQVVRLQLGKVRVRWRLPSPRMRPTASLVLS